MGLDLPLGILRHHQFRIVLAVHISAVGGDLLTAALLSRSRRFPFRRAGGFRATDIEGGFGITFFETFTDVPSSTNSNGLKSKL